MILCLMVRLSFFVSFDKKAQDETSENTHASYYHCYSLWIVKSSANFDIHASYRESIFVLKVSFQVSPTQIVFVPDKRGRSLKRGPDTNSEKLDMPKKQALKDTSRLTRFDTLASALVWREIGVVDS